MRLMMMSSRLAQRPGHPHMVASQPSRPGPANRLVYQHGYHAGCFQDILKHTVLILLMNNMRLKEKPFAYVETHSGAGRYDLSAALAHETAEGIFQLQAAARSGIRLPPEATTLLALVNEQSYPGSPLVAASLCRPQDSLALCELMEDQHALLTSALESALPPPPIGPAATAHLADGYRALSKLKGEVATPSRRGLVLIDPPYSYGSDTQRAVALAKHLRVHWRSARLCLWYPATRSHTKVLDEFSDAGVGECLAIELYSGGAVTKGSGMLLIHPPFGIEDDARRLLTGLSEALRADGDEAPTMEIRWVATGEAPADEAAAKKARRRPRR